MSTFIRNALGPGFVGLIDAPQEMWLSRREKWFDNLKKDSEDEDDDDHKATF
jgi:hypothetical protein